MFTGIIEAIGTVESVAETAGGRRVTVTLGSVANDFASGASVAIDGICLTAAAVHGESASFDIIDETLQTSTAGRLGAGNRVNLERALAAGAQLDGHIVQGHVDGTATVTRVERRGWMRVDFAAPRELTALMVTRGSVAVDGVSLTLAAVGDDDFSVALIPETLEHTTLSDMPVGRKVNIETDILGKYILAFLRRMGKADPAAREGLTMEQLRNGGFM